MNSDKACNETKSACRSYILLVLPNLTCPYHILHVSLSHPPPFTVRESPTPACCQPVLHKAHSLRLKVASWSHLAVAKLLFCIHTDQMRMMLIQYTGQMAGPAVLPGSGLVAIDMESSFDVADAASVLQQKQRAMQKIVMDPRNRLIYR